MRPKILLLLSVAAAAGCTVGPDYQHPRTSVPSDFGPATQPATQSVVDLKRWWQTFDDPMLNRLIDEAVASNLDVRLADALFAKQRTAVVQSRRNFSDS